MPITIKHPDTYKCSICNKEYTNINSAIKCENNIPKPRYKIGDTVNVYDSKNHEEVEVIIEEIYVTKHDIKYKISKEITTDIGEGFSQYQGETDIIYEYNID